MINKKVLDICVQKLPMVLFICVVAFLIVTVVSIQPISANEFEPNGSCPSCKVYGYRYVCNDSRCIGNSSGPHGVYEIQHCTDCDGKIKEESYFKYCHNYC